MRSLTYLPGVGIARALAQAELTSRLDRTHAPHNQDLFSISTSRASSFSSFGIVAVHWRERLVLSRETRSANTDDEIYEPSRGYALRVQCARFIPSLRHAPRYMSLCIIQELFPSGAISRARRRGKTARLSSFLRSILQRFLLLGGALCKHDIAGDDM